jgi:hypothetical protein
MAFSRLWQYLAEFFLEWEMFQIKVGENVKTYILFVNFFFFESLAFYDTISKHGGTRGHRRQYGACALHAG